MISRNSAYLLLFPSLRDRSGVAVLARRVFPETPKLLVRAYEHLLANSTRIPYVILDLRPRLESDLYRLRNTFDVSKPLVVFTTRKYVSGVHKK